MGNYRRKVQIAIFLIILAVAGWTVWNNFHSSHTIPTVGTDAPNFSLKGTDGKIHQLSDYRGKVVLINFWGTYCPPCKKEMPAIQKQYDRWKKSGLVVLGVNLGESPITVNSFVREHKISFPILYDLQKNIAHQYAVNEYPTSFFVNTKGRIINKVEGPMTEAYIQQRLINLLKQ